MRLIKCRRAELERRDHGLKYDISKNQNLRITGFHLPNIILIPKFY